MRLYQLLISRLDYDILAYQTLSSIRLVDYQCCINFKEYGQIITVSHRWGDSELSLYFVHLHLLPFCNVWEHSEGWVGQAVLLLFFT